ncbi:ferritin-like domain-containing protein [Hymenobacter rubidus]|uniref:ferritin-like domain-containing protein n=1 Tax=Hymenobacter rubidus TaxID=1441626 RepID=UPI00191D6B10|nr:ferritin-like domain-containing protein [Hymenobacter rubidus]
MKLISLLDRLAATPGAPTTATPRRELLQQFGRVAVAALPLAFGSLPAAAGTKETSYDALTQLLLLERLQKALYTQALAASGLIPATQIAGFQRMLLHQTQHEAFLVLVLQNAGAAIQPVPTFDFSGRHGVSANPVLFPNVLSDYDAFLALAQQLEDLGVRLYKTHTFSVSDSQALKSLLRQHAVEAEHSAHVRGLRRGRGVVVKNWPSDADAPIARPAAAQALTTAATGGDENVFQYLTAGVKVPFSNFLLIRDNTAIHDTALAEAFDEPVSLAVAQAALSLFI